MSPRSHHPRRPGFLRAGVVAVAVAVGMPAAAQAAHHTQPSTVRVCATPVLLVETPGGAVTGIVHHSDLLHVIHGGRHARWWRVRTSFGVRGWLRQTDLCRRVG